MSAHAGADAIERSPTAAGTPVWTSGEAGARACARTRRKLWQPGEGWMVKRVNVCP